MATLTVEEIRQRVATVIKDHDGAWRESPRHYDAFPADPGHFAHKAYAVGAPGTEFESPMESVRHKRGEDGGLVDTQIGVRWTYRIKIDGGVKAYDAMLASEALLLKALTGISLVSMHFWVTSLTRSPTGNHEWLLGQLLCVARHRIAIQ